MPRLTRNIIYNLIGQGLLLVLGFVAVKYVFKELGEDALGIIYFTLMMNAVLVGVLDLGIFATTVREISAHFNDEPGYIGELIRTASLFCWSAYVLLAVAVYFGAPLLVEKWIYLKTIDSGTATQVLQVLGIGALIAFPRSLYSSLFRGLQRMEFNNIIDVGTTALQQLGVIMILAFGGKLLPVAYWLSASFGLGMLCYVLCAHRFFPWWTFVPCFFTGVVRRNLRYSSNMMSISFLAMVQMQADKVIMSKLLPIGLLGYYGFAYSAVSRATLLTSAIAQAAFPSFSSLFRTRGRDCMMPQYRKLQDLVCFGSVPLFAAIPFAAIPVFGFVFDPYVAKMLLLPITFLAIGFYMNGTLNVPYVFSLAVGRPDISVRSNFYALFIVLPVTGILIYYFGLAGASFSWVFYHVFGYSYAVPRICSECLEIPVSEWYWHVFKIALLACLTYGLAWLIFELLEAHSILYAGLSYTGASIIFLAGSFFMMGSELRETLVEGLHALKMRVAHLISHWSELYPVSLRKSRNVANPSAHPRVDTEVKRGWDE